MLGTSWWARAARTIVWGRGKWYREGDGGRGTSGRAWQGGKDYKARRLKLGRGA